MIAYVKLSKLVQSHVKDGRVRKGQRKVIERVKAKQAMTSQMKTQTKMLPPMRPWIQKQRMSSQRRRLKALQLIRLLLLEFAKFVSVLSKIVVNVKGA